ncbi:MAG: acyltransferase [Lachnospiraceae bacterium]|nr:acyltransferase [Lachnospiraceae bacterium]
MISVRNSLMLRGIAILIVIGSHYAGWMFVEPVHVRAHDWISTWGPIGVDIFFLLSGYGLTVSAARGSGENCKSGINGRFVAARIIGSVLPYYILAALINCYSGAWVSGYREGNLLHVIRDYLVAEDFWFMQVLFVFYVLFIIAFRFGGRIRLPLVLAAAILYTVLLVQSGHADFWELSNMAFPLGIVAATLELAFPKRMKSISVRAAIFAAGAIGFFVSFLGMEQTGGSGAETSFFWELSMNLFFAVLVLGAASVLPDWKGRVLPILGKNSLFIYLLHTVLFWGMMIKLDELPYAQAAVITGVVTLFVCVLVGTAYNRVTGLFMKKKGRAGA